MKRMNNRWTKPETIVPFGDSLQITCGDPFLSIDNKRFYFSADIEGTNNGDLWFIERQSNGGGKPQKLSSLINTTEIQAQATFNSDGTVYYLEAKGNTGPFYIFRSKLEDGNYLQPDALPHYINSTAAQDWTPYIAPDDSYLIFSSSRVGGFGQGDLYISFHDVNADTWSEPINLGEPINTQAQERLPAVSPDGKYLFFTRWTPDQDQDVFWVSARIINRLSTFTKDENKIVDIINLYGQELNNNNVESLSQLFTEDAIVVLQGAPTTIGTEAVLKFYTLLFNILDFDLKFKIDEVVQMSPEWAFVRTTVTSFSSSSKNPSSGHELFILKKQADGNWKIAKYAGSSSK